MTAYFPPKLAENEKTRTLKVQGCGTQEKGSKTKTQVPFSAVGETGTWDSQSIQSQIVYYVAYFL